MIWIQNDRGNIMLRRLQRLRAINRTFVQGRSQDKISSKFKGFLLIIKMKKKNRTTVIIL